MTKEASLTVFVAQIKYLQKLTELDLKKNDINCSNCRKNTEKTMVACQKPCCGDDGESYPDLPRDRRGYSPLYYRGLLTFGINTLRTGDNISLRHPKEMWDVPRGQPREFG